MPGRQCSLSALEQVIAGSSILLADVRATVNRQEIVYVDHVVHCSLDSELWKCILLVFSIKLRQSTVLLSLDWLTDKIAIPGSEQDHQSHLPLQWANGIMTICPTMFEETDYSAFVIC